MNTQVKPVPDRSRTARTGWLRHHTPDLSVLPLLWGGQAGRAAQPGQTTKDDEGSRNGQTTLHDALRPAMPRPSGRRIATPRRQCWPHPGGAVAGAWL